MVGDRNTKKAKTTRASQRRMLNLKKTVRGEERSYEMYRNCAHFKHTHVSTVLIYELRPVNLGLGFVRFVF